MTPSTDEERQGCLMCNDKYQERHIDNDEDQDNRLNKLERRFLWILLASFVGSTTGSFASGYMSKVYPNVTIGLLSWLGLG